MTKGAKLTLKELHNKYLREVLHPYSRLVHTSPFQQQIVQARDEQYIRYHALSNAMCVFDRYASKRGVVKWLTGQIQTYQQAADKAKDEGVRRVNSLSADCVQELLNTVLEAC